jgi:elongator complex protein 2
MSANLPVLGLSNKESTATEDDVAPSSFLENLSTPPVEDHLSRHTLSPELEKLYAHPSEIIAVSTSHSGQYIASSCKAATPINAVIRVFNTETYAELAVLKGHGLTVTKLAWSEDDSLLVSVGRDRQWSLYDTTTWTIKKVATKAHARIIWDVSFAPMVLGNIFVTGSRDKSVKIWGGEDFSCLATVKFPEAVTSCVFLRGLVNEMGIIAVGLENGALYIIGCEKGRVHWRVIYAFVERDTPSEAVTALEWRPQSEEGKLGLAAASDDCSLRIYDVRIA